MRNNRILHSLKYLPSRYLIIRKREMATPPWKSGRHHLNQMIKVNITSNETCCQHVPPEMIPLRKTASVLFNAKNVYPEPNEETPDKPKLRGSLLNTLCSSKIPLA